MIKLRIVKKIGMQLPNLKPADKKLGEKKNEINMTVYNSQGFYKIECINFQVCPSLTIQKKIIVLIFLTCFVYRGL